MKQLRMVVVITSAGTSNPGVPLQNSTNEDPANSRVVSHMYNDECWESTGRVDDLDDADGLIVVIKHRAESDEETPQEMPQVLIHSLMCLLLRLLSQGVALGHEVCNHHVDQAETGDATIAHLVQPVGL